MELQPTNWFAVQSNPRREQFAAIRLAGEGLEVFLPRVRADLARRQRVGPMFPGYFFARFRPAADLDRVRYAPGVHRVVSSGSRPVPVPDETILELRGRADADGVITLRTGGRLFRSGDRVEIQDGPLRGLVGRVEREKSGERRLMILLECLLHSRVAVDACRLMPAR